MYGRAMATPSPTRLPRQRSIGLAPLRGFECAARHLSFTAAAAELNLTQSSISRQISTLEQQIGKALFVRKTRALALTAAGVQLQQAVRQALATVDQSVDALRGTGGARRLTLSTYPSFASLWLAPRLAPFQRRHPDIEIRLDASDRVVDLQAEDVDLAVRWMLAFVLLLPLGWRDDRARERGPRERHGERDPCGQEGGGGQVHALVSRPLAGQHGEVGVPGALGQNWASWFDYAGAGIVEPRAGRLVFSFNDQTVQAAIRGQGVALVHSPFLEDCVASGDLLMPFPKLRMPAGYRHVLVVHPDVARRPHVAEFVGWLREQFAQAPQLGA